MGFIDRQSLQKQAAKLGKTELGFMLRELAEGTHG